MPICCVRKFELRMPRCYPGQLQIGCGFEEQPSAAHGQPPTPGRAIHGGTVEIPPKFLTVTTGAGICLTCISAETFPFVNLSFWYEMHVQGELME